MTMPEKTRLELDIDNLEKFRIPLSVRIVFALLILCLCALGVYIFSLHQALSLKEQEAVMMKEQIELMERVRELEDKQKSSGYEE
jgi:Tfp pilus assembly protein PilO